MQAVYFNFSRKNLLCLKRGCYKSDSPVFAKKPSISTVISNLQIISCFLSVLLNDLTEYIR